MKTKVTIRMKTNKTEIPKFQDSNRTLVQFATAGEDLESFVSTRYFFYEMLQALAPLKVETDRLSLLTYKMSVQKIWTEQPSRVTSLSI